MRPPASGRPTRTTPHSPRALDPVDAATHAPGPGLGPRAALPASRGSHGPRGAPDGHADTLARAPPAAWPAQRTRPRLAPGPHGVGPLEPLLTADWAAHASQRPPRPPRPLGRPPLLMRPAPASAPSSAQPPTQPAHRGSLGPQRGPHRARRRPRSRALRSKTCRTRPPSARPPTPLCGTLRATADRRLDRPRPPATATGPAPAWRHNLPGRPPLPTRTARAATPGRLCRAASRTQGTGTGTREQHMNRAQHASDSEPMFVLLCSRPCALPPP